MRLSLFFLLLAACNPAPSPDERKVTLVMVKTPAEARTICGKDDPFLGYGCANGSALVAGGAGTECRIVAIRPRSFDDHAALETLGHELWHCYNGPAHD